MNGPALSPSEIRQILGRSVDRYLAIGLDRSAAIAATAGEFGASEYKVAALVETEHPPTGLLLATKQPVEHQSTRCSLACFAHTQRQ